MLKLASTAHNHTRGRGRHVRTTSGPTIIFFSRAFISQSSPSGPAISSPHLQQSLFFSFLQIREQRRWWSASGSDGEQVAAGSVSRRRGKLRCGGSTDILGVLHRGCVQSRRPRGRSAVAVSSRAGEWRIWVAASSRADERRYREASSPARQGPGPPADFFSFFFKIFLSESFS
jgi:hypothetical protein